MIKKIALVIFFEVFGICISLAVEDSCLVLLALHKNKKLTIRPQMGVLSKNGIFFYVGEHITVLFEDKKKITVSEIIRLTNDSLLISNGYNVDKKTDTLRYLIKDIHKIYYNGWVLSNKSYSFIPYKLKDGCYSSDVASPEEIEKAKNWWKKR